MTVSVNADIGVAGFIQPGDRADLVQAVGDTSKGGATQTILSNVRVLAVDQTTTPAANGKTITGSTITLEVPNQLTEVGRRGQGQGRAFSGPPFLCRYRRPDPAPAMAARPTAYASSRQVR